MSDDRSRSILLQVAFKGAIQGGGTIEEIGVLTNALFEMLEAKHAHYNISLEDSKRGGGFNKAPASAPATGDSFTYNGSPWMDFRANKKSGTLKPGFPDFKPVDGRNDEAVWLYSQDGGANEEAAPLVVAADAKLALAAVMA